MIGNGLDIASLMQARNINNTFTALYSFYDMIFYSNQLLVSCTGVFMAAGEEADQTAGGLFSLSRLFFNFSHNFVTAIDDYLVLSTFLTTEWPADETEAQKKAMTYEAGLSTGSVF